MSYRNLASLVFVTLLAGSWACAGGGGGATSALASAVWDQAKVTDIAKQLPDLTGSLYDSLSKQGQEMVTPGGMGGGDATAQLRDTAKTPHEESKGFVSKLENGAGQDETANAFNRLSELGRDASEFAGDVPGTEAVTSQLGAVTGVLKQLAPFFGG